MPKIKKMGRPKLPKGHVKAKIVPVRFGDSELKVETKGAKVYKQTLSDFIRDGLRAWDYRLDQHGIDAIVWDGAGDGHSKTLGIIFKEIVRGPGGENRLAVDQKLSANDEQNYYSSAVIDEKLKRRGIEQLWVTTTKTPFLRSRIHIKFADLDEPVTIMKRY
jgi:hypothetical protein